VSQDTLAGVMMFVNGYIVTLGVLSVALTLTGVDVTSAIFAIWTSMGNIGYGYGPLVAATGTFRDFPEAAIWIMTLAMLMGRLGLLAIFVLALPRFWAA
jgi:trk system potassium uptake protein TrkH